MNNQKTVLSSKRQAIEDKKRRQEKIMIVLGIAMAVLVVILTVCWMIYNIHMAQTKKLSDEEMLALFEDKKALPDKDDVLVGTWYYYVGNDVRSKYELDTNGMMKVYERNGNDFTLTNIAPYRVREKAKTLYVYPEGAQAVITYEYAITEQSNNGKPFYFMTWTNGERGWSMIKVSEK